MRSSQLAEHALLDRARTSKAVTSLLAKQLITRSPGPGDRRQAQLALTERGAALHADMLPQVVAINQQLLSTLPDDAVALLDQSLSQLQQHAEQSGLVDTLPRTGRHLGRGRRTAAWHGAGPTLRFIGLANFLPASHGQAVEATTRRLRSSGARSRTWK